MELKINLTDGQFKVLLSWLDPKDLTNCINIEEEKLLMSYIDINDLPMKVINIFKREDIQTYMDLVKHSDDGLLRYKGMGQRTHNAIVQHLREKGLSLGMLKYRKI